MLCSILIASRNRPEKLHLAIDSVYQITKNKENIEFLLRVDDDDEPTIKETKLLEAKYNVKTIIGSRKQGYPSHPEFMEELVQIARGEWLFFNDDDAQLLQPWRNSLTWDEQLANIPQLGNIVHPEYYWLNSSHYPSGSCDPVAMFCPLKATPELGYPVDAWLQTHFLAKGWHNYWLKDIVCFHTHFNDGGGRWAK